MKTSYEKQVIKQRQVIKLIFHKTHIHKTHILLPHFVIHQKERLKKQKQKLKISNLNTN